MGLLDHIQGRKVYLDTNIFIYAIEGFEDFEDDLAGLFRAIDRGEIEGVTSELTLAEALVKPIEEENERQQQIYKETLQSRRYFRIQPVIRTILVEAAHLRVSTSLRLPDAIHLASAYEADCSTLITNDAEFEGAPNIEVIILSEVIKSD